jgi:hypothetical protein
MHGRSTPCCGLPAFSITGRAERMLPRSLPALFATVASVFLWAAAFQELAKQPTTHTGTQSNPHALPLPPLP